MSTGSAASSYYITLDAIDPAAGGGALVTFRTKVSEQSFGKFILDCHIAKVRGETRDGKGFLMIDHSFPKCPPQNPFETYYLVKESELAWILLYLQLAVATTHRKREVKDFGLPNLEILDVAIDDEQGLYAKNAVFYIRYKDYLYRSNLAHDLDRIAIVRRCFDKATGCFSLVGQNLSSHLVIPNMPKIAYEDTTGCSTFNGHILSPEPSTLGTSEDHEAANHLAILSILLILSIMRMGA
ncbi:Protein MS5 [Arabidopsis suecica]|uniref:Protein MS5 n=1 Tax=Arabidopsis suecica TaxID=45249 RepID=A0A8T1ZBT4_ARASU|nr:Protein MS5 [Arabidopsis suecica]